MKRRNNSKRISIVAVLLLVPISLIFLAFQNESRDFKISKNLDIFFSLFRELNTFYVDDIDPDKLVKTGIDNMLRTLDPYTVYYPESDADELTLITTGKYGGIGSLIRAEGEYCIISGVYKGFPADIAGIKPGDVLMSVDGASIKGLSSDEVSERLKGNPGTEVEMTLLSNGEEKKITIKRERVAIPPVPYYGMIDSNTGYICFTSFTQNCVADVRSALLDLKTHNPKQIILDIRSNGGGLLSEAVEIVNLFVGPDNEVVSTKGKVKRFDETYKTTKEAVDANIPLAVLINRSSASASEIVAGAIQDLDRGVIIGERSYGKGLVQISRPLSYNTQLKVTTAKYYTPSGRCVQAIDFSQRNEDGSVGSVPDSLIKEFKTRNGRIVRDGGGIAPDVEVKAEMLSQVATELYVRNLIFDYSTKYYWEHKDIHTIEDFEFTDYDYADFYSFLVERDFDYQTLTETALSDLVTTAKREKYYDLYEALFKELQQDLSHSLSQDLDLFKEEIVGLLEDDIVSRYFYEEGMIQWSVQKDKQVIKAIEILNDSQKYDSLLTFSSRPSV